MNCTKEESLALVEKYWKRNWEHIKNIQLPDTREKPISEQHLKNEFTNLCNKDLKNDSKSDLIHVFFPSIVTANKSNSLSPAEGWKKLQEDPETFKAFLENRFRCSDWYKEKNGQNWHFLEEGVCPDFIYAIGLTTSGKYPVVSSFKPSTAKNLILKYLSKYDEIFDPCCGYGGRYLGTISLNKKYIGYDINDITISENKNLMSWIESNFENKKGLAKFECKDSFNETGKFECLFTCPPYSKPISKNKTVQIEEWISSTGKISCEFTCDEIITKLLKNYECEKYVFIVDDSINTYREYIVEKKPNRNYIGARNGKLTEASKNFEAIVIITKEQRNKILDAINI